MSPIYRREMLCLLLEDNVVSTIGGQCCVYYRRTMLCLLLDESTEGDPISCRITCSHHYPYYPYILHYTALY